LVKEALDYARLHGKGLGGGLFAKLESMLAADAIRIRRMGHRARYLSLPLFGSWIELEPGSLGLDPRYDWKAAMAVCSSEKEVERTQREALIRAKAEQSWLFVAAALVHEGTHAALGLTHKRKEDERAAYQAECRFLSNVLAANPAPLVRNAAQSLLGDARRDARDKEGLEL
jgi:hypothetical protein